MSNPVTESYEIKTEDNELHAISVMLECLSRHLSNKGKDCATSDEYEQHLKLKQLRVTQYVLDRVMSEYV